MQLLSPTRTGLSFMAASITDCAIVAICSAFWPRVATIAEHEGLVAAALESAGTVGPAIVLKEHAPIRTHCVRSRSVVREADVTIRCRRNAGEQRHDPTRQSAHT